MMFSARARLLANLMQDQARKAVWTENNEGSQSTAAHFDWLAFWRAARQWHAVINEESANAVSEKPSRKRSPKRAAFGSLHGRKRDVDGNRKGRDGSVD